MPKSTVNIPPPKPKIKQVKVPGQTDWMPDDFQHLEFIMDHVHKLASSFGFQRIEPPLFEPLIGEKKPYVFTESGRPAEYNTSSGEKAFLRSSGLHGALRMYAEASLPEEEKITKWYYLLPIVVEQDNPYQLITTWEYGFLLFGEHTAMAEAQLLALGCKLYTDLGNENLALEVGSQGCEQCWPEYQKVLAESLGDLKYNLCKECATKVEDSPEAVLMCKETECQNISAEAPSYLNYLDQACSDHLTAVLEALDELGIAYNLTPSGKDVHPEVQKTYFNFRFNHPQDSFILSQAMRHDHLFKNHDHEIKPAAALAGSLTGFKRAWHLSGAKPRPKENMDVAIIPFGELASKKTLVLFSMFWDEGISVLNVMGEHSLKTRLEQVVEMKIPVALIIGRQEALDGTVILRDVKSGMQEVFPLDRVLTEVKKRLGE